MLQRAASNAYSWWWASHIRTKQSKWLEESLQDMEIKVGYMLKLIQEDGDSFAKRAEMYYKRRPELINFVEESYRAFRSLAERYDKLSKDLQSANHTLATLCPEQFQMEMDDDDDEFGSPKARRNIRQFQRPATNIPKAPSKKLKVVITTAAVSNKLQPKKPATPEVVKKTPPKSGLTMNQASDEIDKLQKEILKLQTAKEFVKSSYQSGQARYKGIENQITEMQQRVCRLQDEFGVRKAIEDEEARTLMAESALKSCRETLAQLFEKQLRAAREAKEEYKKLEDARKRMNILKLPHLRNKTNETTSQSKSESENLVYKSESSRKEVGAAIEALQEKIKEQLDGNSIGSLTVTQLVEKIDELVNKVVNMETTVSTQTILIDRLRGEANDFQKKVRSLEDDKTTVSKDDLTTQVDDIEKRWKDIRNINQDLENHNSSLRTNIAEARCNLDQLSEKLTNVKSDEEEESEAEGVGSSQSEAESLLDLDPKESIEKKPDPLGSGEIRKEEVKTEAEKQDPNTGVAKKEEEVANSSKKEEEVSKSLKKEEEVSKSLKKQMSAVDKTPSKKIQEEASTSPKSGDSDMKNEQEIVVDKEDEQDWREALLNGMGDKERAILKEYKMVLRNYKELKKKLVEMEKKDRDCEFEFTLQIRELKTSITKKDEEIQQLRQKVNALSENCAENKEPKEVKLPVPDQTAKAEPRIYDDDDDDEDDFKIPALGKPVLSPVEEKLRMEIDAILDENLEFWLRFSSSFHQIQKFKTTVTDLQHELSKVKQKKSTQENSTETQDLRTEVRPIFKHLREIHTELTVWLDQSVSLRDELKRRSSSLCHIQEEITKALKEGVEGEEIQFSSHQAAKFQGEVLNMKQENNKVREELQAGVDHVTILQLDVEKTLKKLGQEFGLTTGKAQLTHSTSKSKIPLGSFIFGNKPKKQKKSVFSCIHPNKKYQVLKAVIDLT